MTIQELCEKIDLQAEVREKVLHFASDFDFDKVKGPLQELMIYNKMKEARIEVQHLLGEDEDHIKILTCMLKASADHYMFYSMRGINDEIYFATMKCYTRFLKETYRMTGKLYFDRQWWTARQAGCHLFRIGELEYEIKRLEGSVIISIHIPSDADFSPSAVNISLQSAKNFFAQFFPEFSTCEYHCHSWLLDQQLRRMLGQNSNILDFQNRFRIYAKGEADTEFMEWLYQTKSTDIQHLPENTSLQRRVKRHLLSGGVIHNSYGILIE